MHTVSIDKSSTPLRARGLCPLIRIEQLGNTVSGERLVQHFAIYPAHNCHQIEKAYAS